MTHHRIETARWNRVEVRLPPPGKGGNVLTKSIPIALVSLALVVVLGCGGGQATLGSQQEAGPFKVVLNTEPNPPVEGQVRFTVTVTKDEKPIEDATVSVETSQPTLNTQGPTLTLAPGPTGYEGGMNMATGKWQFVVTVSSGSDKGTATYTFDVK
jgi:hypothetical protein